MQRKSYRNLHGASLSLCKILNRDAQEKTAWGHKRTREL